MKNLLNMATQSLLMADWGSLTEGILRPIKDFVNGSWLTIVAAAITALFLYAGIIGAMYGLSQSEDKAAEKKVALKRGFVGIAIIVIIAILIFTIPNILVGIIEAGGGDIWG